jgi:hypothetical protein
MIGHAPTTTGTQFLHLPAIQLSQPYRQIQESLYRLGHRLGIMEVGAEMDVQAGKVNGRLEDGRVRSLVL